MNCTYVISLPISCHLNIILHPSSLQESNMGQQHYNNPNNYNQQGCPRCIIIIINTLTCRVDRCRCLFYSMLWVSDTFKGIVHLKWKLSLLCNSKSECIFPVCTDWKNNTWNDMTELYILGGVACYKSPAVT